MVYREANNQQGDATMDRNKAIRIRQALERAIATVSKSDASLLRGMVASVGRTTFGSTNVTYVLQLAETDAEGTAMTQSATAYRARAETNSGYRPGGPRDYTGLRKAWLGKTVEPEAGALRRDYGPLTLVGLNTKKPKYPVEFRVEGTGQTLCLTVEATRKVFAVHEALRTL